MFARLLPFELRLHFNQVGFWVAAGLLALIGYFAASTDSIVLGAAGGEKIKINGALVVATQIGMFSFLPILFASVFVVTGIMRDETAKSLEIVHATPVSTFDMIAARMIGVFLATFAVVLAGVIGLFAGQFATWLDKEKLGPINPLFYLYPAIVLGAVNSALLTALFTAIAGITRSRMMVYAGAIGLLILFLVVGLFVGEDASDLALSLSDPFGLSAIQVITEFWPAFEQNSRLVPLMGYFGLNRLVWLAVSLVVLAAMFRFFPRGVASSRSRRAANLANPNAGVAPRRLSKPLSEGTLAAAWSRCQFEYMAVVKSVAFAILMSLVIALFATTVYVQAEFNPDPLLPTSAQMAAAAAASALLPMLCLIVFFSGEIFWREKTYKVLELVDSTRVSNVALLIGKWVALGGVVLSVLFAAMLVGVAAQLVLGGPNINLWTHFQLIIVNYGPDFLILSGVALFIQNFTPNRIVGMVAVAGVLVGTMFFLPQTPIDHPLLNIGRLPTGGYSEMNGVGDMLTYQWTAAYWGAFTVLLAVLSAWMWRRGLNPSLISRLRGQGGRLGPVTAGVGILAMCGFTGAGAVLYKGYSIDNTFRNKDQTEQYLAEVEKTLGDRLDDPAPKVRDVSVSLDMFPETQTARVSGRYRLDNPTGAAISEVFITVPSLKPDAVKVLLLDGATEIPLDPKAENLDNENVRLFRFSPALAPGASTNLAFDLVTLPPQIGYGSPILRNGTFVNGQQLMPSIGLVDFRLRDKDVRRKRGLPELERLPEREDMAARKFNFFDRNSDYVTFRASFCTAPDQIPIAPGRMVRSYEKNGRACRDYAPIEPIANFFAFVSARYAVKRDAWNGPNGERVPVEIYYHAPHAFNVDLMLEAMKKSLSHYTRAFGPYQYSDLRIMEFPYADFAQSFAGTIPFSENIGFIRDPGDPKDAKRIDLATYVTMHEIAHQWFGHQIVPSHTKGFNVLSEGLTEHAAMSAYEEAYGWATARRLVERRSMEGYLTSRTMDSEDEPPLGLAEGQQYLDYNKSAWVFWGLRQTMGADRVNAALRQLLNQYGRKGPPYPTTLDLVAALRAEAGPQWAQLITDYFDRITLWDLALGAEDVALTRSGEGWIADIRFTADKLVAAQETGEEISVLKQGEALNEWVEIGFYEKDPKETMGAEWMRIERVRVTAQEGRVRIHLARKPAFVVLDPRRILIERNVKDNVAELRDAA
jgi:ABC-type transport system involved in multi-copper enzyme maturation permease subunit